MVANERNWINMFMARRAEKISMALVAIIALCCVFPGWWNAFLLPGRSAGTQQVSGETHNQHHTTAVVPTASTGYRTPQSSFKLHHVVVPASTSAPPHHISRAQRELTLWSNDLHIGPIEDLKDIFARLQPMITVHWLDHSFSVYCKFTNSCATSPKIRSVLDFGKLKAATDKHVMEFHKVFRDDPLIRTVDAFVCSHPPTVCRFFVPFSKPIIACIAVPFYSPWAVGSHELGQWKKELPIIAKDKKNVVVANNGFLEKLAPVQVGLPIRFVPNLCLYTKAHHRSTIQQGSQTHILVMRNPVPQKLGNAQRLNEIARVQKLDATFTAYPQGMKWSSVADEYTCVLYCPGLNSMMVFYETYNMNVPMILPSMKLSMKHQLKQQVQMLGRHDPYFLGQRPFKKLEEWFLAMDYYSGKYPHLLYFEGEAQLMSVVSNTTPSMFADISKRMAERTKLLLHESVQFWSDALLHVGR